MQPAPKRDSGDATEGYNTKLQTGMDGVPQVAEFHGELSGIGPLTSWLQIQTAEETGVIPKETE
jgi:hypothetical protein